MASADPEPNVTTPRPRPGSPSTTPTGLPSSSKSTPGASTKNSATAPSPTGSTTTPTATPHPCHPTPRAPSWQLCDAFALHITYNKHTHHADFNIDIAALTIPRIQQLATPANTETTTSTHGQFYDEPRRGRHVDSTQRP